MANAFNQTAVSSMTSILKSIEYDRQVYRWFLMLITMPKVQQKLSLNKKTNAIYQDLRKIQTAEIMTYVLIALIMLVSYLIKQPLIISGQILPLGILVILFRNNRKRVAAISEQFLLENIKPEELSRQSLYQTCEYISKDYTIPSLVDIITYQDFIGRKVLLGTVLFLPFIYSFKTWQLLVVIFIVFSATIAIVNTSIVLRRLK